MNHMTSHDKTCPVRTGLKLEASLQRKSRPAVTQQHVTNNEYRLSAGVFREKWKISKNIKSIVHFYNNTSREGRRNQGDACKDTTITRKNEPPSSASTVFSGIQSNIVFHVFVFSYCFVWVQFCSWSLVIILLICFLKFWYFSPPCHFEANCCFAGLHIFSSSESKLHFLCPPTYAVLSFCKVLCFIIITLSAASGNKMSDRFGMVYIEAWVLWILVINQCLLGAGAF